jgi:hypothetical protein
MNCHDFEGIASDLAKDHLMVADQRERALAHSASCAHCAERLADERTLTDGLRLLAKTASEQAPASVEQSLLKAFRDQRTARPAVSIYATRRRWMYVAASVAAIALIVTILAFATRNRESQPPVPEKAVIPTPLTPEAPRQSPSTTITPEKTVAVRSSRAAGKALATARASRSKPLNYETEKLNPSDEIATEFIPLMNREALSQMDGGQVMRVELPRSALMTFGLPMDMERATERIKADVLVGNDGLARAIRFVR